jgi:DNA invertase Pin-like site-specific DNA recombinase
MLGIYCRTSRETDIDSSTISQQRTIGIKFAEEHNFEYELYEDEGKSGFKVSDDDQDPFNNRPAFTKLINDIKDKKIDKVWVWEHSRLSRNDFASAVIFKTFKKFNITLYENQKELDLNDPQFKFMRQILDAVSEYERQLIVSRTTRGQHKRINEGGKWHKALYGYKIEGKDDKGYAKWVPVESEINNYKYALQRYNEGATLLKICYEIYDMNKVEKHKFINYVGNMSKILRRYQYTGYQLTIEGYEIYKKFRRNEIKTIAVLLDRKYWVKSFVYPFELISIEDWVKVNERLQTLSMNLFTTRKDRLLRARKDIATGIMECGDCGVRFYFKEVKSSTVKDKNGNKKIYTTYYHLSRIKKPVCHQKPKSFKLSNINEIFKIFYFYFYVVFDNTNDLIEESQRNIKQIQAKLKEKIVKLEKEISIIENRIEKFKRVMDKQGTDDLLEMILRNIKESEDKLTALNIELSKLKIDYEIQNEKFNQTEREMTYYDVKERVNDWFFKLNIEEQRNELIRTIKACKIFNHYIVIDTGKIVFIFDIKRHHVFDMKLLDRLDKDEIYKKHFVEMKGKREAKKLNDELIKDINLDRDKKTRNLVFRYIVERYEILYPLDDTIKVISLLSFRGLFSQDDENTE